MRQFRILSLPLILTTCVLALATPGQGDDTTLFGWDSAITVSSSAGLDRNFYDLGVYDAGNLVHTVYTRSGTVYHRSVDGLTGSVSAEHTISASAGSPSVAVDAAGNLHVAYYDTVNQDLVYARSNDSGTSWSSVTLDGSAEDRGQGTAITVDPAGRIHLAYRGANGIQDGPDLDFLKGDGSLPFYDLFYTRFNGNALSGNTLTAGNWDSSQVVLHSGRATDGRNIIMVGTQYDNFDIRADANRVWVMRREGENSETQSGGYFLYRGVGATAGSAFSESTSSPYGGGAVWATSMKSQFDLRADGTPYRAVWDRMQQYYSPGTSDGFLGQPYDLSGNPLDTDGAAGHQAEPIDIGLHASYFNVGQKNDIRVDLNDFLMAVYYNTASNQLRFAFSPGDGTWINEAIPGAGAGYNTVNRIDYDPLLTLTNRMGEIWILSSTPGGNLVLFSREASFFIPEPGTAVLLLLGGLIALRAIAAEGRRQRAEGCGP